MENSDKTPISSSSSPRPSAEEPEPKKVKMSSTTSDDEQQCTTGEGTKIRYKRRKVAIFFAYCGVGYQGMQKNPGAKTIEGELEEALYVSGAVPEQDRGLSKRYDWARSARTDKGVSAVGQVVSGRFYIDPPGFVERLNSNLPSQIRIFGFKRVTASFSSKKFCDRRRYVYLIPVFALDPCCHRDRETVLASLGSENELVKCLECSERGRKVEGLVGNSKRNLELEAVIGETNGLSDRNVVVNSGVTENVDVSLRNEGENGLNKESINDDKGKVLLEEANSKTDLETVVSTQDVAAPLNGGSESNSGALEEEKVNGEDMPAKKSVFTYGEKERERFNKILKYYVGTHNFHNFTTRIKPEDPSAHRFIISFDASTTVVVDGMEFVKCEIVGQSFMLHQIRKMMGLAVAIMRNVAPESLIDKALQKEVSMTVPTAPEVGLYLDECFFTSYNQKWKDTHEEVSMKAYEKEAEEFKMKYIYSHIASTEHKEGTVGLWLHSLNHRNYADLRILDDEGVTTDKKSEIEVVTGVTNDKKSEIEVVTGVTNDKKSEIEVVTSVANDKKSEIEVVTGVANETKSEIEVVTE